MLNPLDRPIWTALAGRHARFAVGSPLALRYRSDVEPFVAARDLSQEAADAVTHLIEPDETVLMIESRRPTVPAGTIIEGDRLGVQMVADQAGFSADLPAGAEPLGNADSAEMIALAELTRPGPFRARTHTMSQFFGIRREGRLVAMAGERLQVPGFSEVSGVCSHPDWRGHGFARALSIFIAARIVARGETPFLHSWADNMPAIRLYQGLGFVIRCEMPTLALRRA
ncbi:MAG TPA: GNAT family N-acetyltransferase [Sphingomicrobium sp.]